MVSSTVIVHAHTLKLPLMSKIVSVKKLTPTGRSCVVPLPIKSASSAANAIAALLNTVPAGPKSMETPPLARGAPTQLSVDTMNGNV